MAKNLEELLKVHGVKHITSLEEIKTYFEFEGVSSPISVTKKNTIIITDNEIFNETYLIDILNVVFAEYPENFKNKEIELLYIDSFDIRLKAVYKQFAEEFELNNDGSESYKRDFEKFKLQPCIICIVPEEIEGLYIFKESMVPFQYPIVCTILQTVFNLPTFDLTKEISANEIIGRIECEGEIEPFPENIPAFEEENFSDEIDEHIIFDEDESVNTLNEML